MSNDKFITLEQLTRTTKGLVNKVNAESVVFDNKIGNLNNLTTTAKTNLVSAINEVVASGGGSGSGTSDYTALTNKPSINNITLTGNLTTSDLGITIPTVTDTYSSSSTDAMSGVAVNSAITTAIGNVNSFDVSVVQTLPSQDIDTHTIYFVPKTGSVTDVHDEYMYINNNWELLGSTAVDLSGYLQTTDIATWAKAANKPTYTASEIGALPDTYKPTFYVNISGNNNDGFSTDKTFNEVLTAYQNGFSVYAIYAKNIYSLYNISQTEGYNNNNPYGFMFSRAATTGIYAIAWTYINNTTTIRYTTKAIPTVTDTYSSSSTAAMSGIAVNSAISSITIPTNVSDLTNDAGYLTSYTETDPVFAASAAAGISSTDISNWNAKSDFSGSYNDLTNKPTIPAAQVQSDWNATSGMGVILNKPTIPTVPTNVSSFTNDAGYLTLADLPIYDGTVQNG